MRYEINKTDAFWVLAVICAIASINMPVAENYTTYRTLGVIILVETVFFLYADYKKCGFNFATIYVLMVCLFNFGQVFYIGFWPEAMFNKTIVLTYFTYEEGVNALRWINYAYLIMCGMILVASKESVVSINVQNDDAVLESFRRKAFILIILTMPVKILIDGNFLLKTMSGGFEYGKHWLNTFPNFIVTIGNFAMIGAAFLLIAYKKAPKKQLAVLAITIAYLMILMLSGRRSENVSYLCILVFIFIITRSSDSGFSMKKLLAVIGILVLGYFLLLFLYTVVHIRTETGYSMQSFFEKMAYYNKKENILLEELREYGQTGYTAICVLQNWLPANGPSYGTSYILGLSSIFPNVGGLMGTLTESSNFGIAMQKVPGVLNTLYRNIGGNVLGEFFFNFGKLGALLASGVLGVIVGKVSRKLMDGIRNVTYSVIYLIPVMFSILYWIRDYFGDTIRDIVWGVMICLVLSKIDEDNPI